MDSKLSRLNVLSFTGFLDKYFSKRRKFSESQCPSYNITTENIKNHIQKEICPLFRAFQFRNIPAPNLIKCGLIVPQNNPLRDIERKLQVNPEWILVGELDGKIIASSMAGYDGHRGWIYYLAVSPQYQRKSYAKQMMKREEQLLKAAGCPKINLQVRATNQKVIEFYESIGFTNDEVISFGKRLEVDELYRIK